MIFGSLTPRILELDSLFPHFHFCNFHEMYSGLAVCFSTSTSLAAHGVVMFEVAHVHPTWESDPATLSELVSGILLEGAVRAAYLQL